MTVSVTNNCPAEAGAPLSDALTKWRQEGGATGPASHVPEFRLDANERLALLFTTSIAEVSVHYVDWPEVRGYLRCHGPSCLLCKVGRQPDRRDLLPVYDPVCRAVSVLAISPTLRPQSLRAQLLALLPPVKDGNLVLVGLRRLDPGRYAVTRLELPEEAEAGASQILEFQDRLQAGQIDLADIYQVIPDHTLATIPQVAAAIALKQISL